ncbi:MAG: DUF2723 domain-containing protein [Patescibacteria group bacterium]|jgi:4-amino-4-deoxy-L-arabinose transferase-like glycosyltransferase
MKHKQLWAFIILFVGAFLFRLIALNQSLWLDEGVTARVVTEYNILEIITKFSPADFHPPLYYIVNSLWSMVFGTSEIALRMPSVIFSLIAGMFVYLIVASRESRVLKSESPPAGEAGLNVSMSALFAAAMFLFNPLVVYYSQEARMYMMATMFITGGVYFLTEVKSIKFKVESEVKNESKSLSVTRLNVSMSQSLMAGICLSLAFATFYGSILIILPLLVYVLFRRNFRLSLILCTLLLTTFLLLSPLLYQQLSHSRESLSVVANWKAVLGTTSIKNLALIFIKFTSGRISFYPKTLYYVLAGLWSLIIWSLVLLGGKKNPPYLFLIICTLSLGVVFSFITPLLQYFRFLFLLPLVAILISSGVKNTAAKSLVLTGFIGWSLLYLLMPGFHREDWKSLARLIDEAKPVYAIPSSMDALTYYRQDLRTNIKDLRDVSQLSKVSVSESLNVNQIMTLRQLDESLQQKGLQTDLVVIPYTSEIYGFDYRHVLGTMGYVQSDVSVVRELSVETWRKK